MSLELSGNDGFGANANSERVHPQWVHDAVKRQLEEQEKAEQDAEAYGRWRLMNSQADDEFFGSAWRGWVRICPLKDDFYPMPWQSLHWAGVLFFKNTTGRNNPDGSQDWFPRGDDRSELWERERKSNHPSFLPYGNKGNVILNGRCPSWCPGCKGDFPGCGRKLLADKFQISFKKAVYELLAQKRIIQELAKTRARCKGPYCAAEKKMKIAKEKSDDAAAKIAKDESDRLHKAYNKADENFKSAANIYKEIFNRWREMDIFPMGYFYTRSFYKLAPPP
jgi:hypothetical protein